MKNEKKAGTFRSYHVSPFVRDNVALYRGSGTMNFALEEANRRARTALSQGARPDVEMGTENAALHLNALTLAEVKATAERFLGYEVSIEDSIRTVLALAAEVKE